MLMRPKTTLQPPVRFCLPWWTCRPWATLERVGVCWEASRPSSCRWWAGVLYTITTPGSESHPIQHPSATVNSARINHKNEQSKGDNSQETLPHKQYLKKSPQNLSATFWSILKIEKTPDLEARGIIRIYNRWCRSQDLNLYRIAPTGFWNRCHA